jgi:hypothetical protein
MSPSMLASMLDADASESERRLDEKEKRFKILYSWMCKFPAIDHKKKLKEILDDAEEGALSETIYTFCRSKFHFQDVVDPSRFVCSRDFEFLSRHLSADYVHFARFLGIPQREIEQMQETYCMIRERVRRLFNVIDANSTCTVNRQDVCDALVYIGKNNVVQELTELWKNS